MSSCVFDSMAHVFVVSSGLDGYGTFTCHNTIAINGAVAPIINLTNEYADTMIGTGAVTDPYRVE